MSCRRHAAELSVLRSKSHGLLFFALFEAAWFLSTGCRPQPEPEIFSVEGVLTVNGEPAANASLAFHPLDRNVNVSCPVGRSDARGVFHLTTHSHFDGAPPGDYAVTIVWPEESSLIDECNCSDILQHDRLKGFYANAEQTEFRVTVKRSANSFRFDAWGARGDDPPPRPQIGGRYLAFYNKDV
jgi:hypothetical protein